MLDAILLLLAQAEAVTPGGEEPKPPVTAETADERSCDVARQQGTDARTITICAQRPQGYRLNPDVMAAKKLKRAGRNGAPRPAENFKQDACATVGPMGCRGQGIIDIPTAVIAAAQMVAKAAKGEDVGKMFQTDKQYSEYELYLLAKAQREAREDEAVAAKARAKVKAQGAGAKRASVADEPQAQE
jgi:hypothetical protein